MDGGFVKTSFGECADRANLAQEVRAQVPARPNASSEVSTCWSPRRRNWPWPARAAVPRRCRGASTWSAVSPNTAGWVWQPSVTARHERRPSISEPSACWSQ